jgi:hypothetical protein
VVRLSRFAAMIAITAMVGACEPVSTSNEANAPPAEQFSPSDPKPLRLAVVVTPLQNGARISGETNLPDGTKLMLGLQRGTVMAGPSVLVDRGRFTADLYPNDGAAIPPGPYEVTVSSPLGDIQDGDVKAQLGSGLRGSIRTIPENGAIRRAYHRI